MLSMQPKMSYSGSIIGSVKSCFLVRYEKPDLFYLILLEFCKYKYEVHNFINSINIHIKLITLANSITKG